MHQPQHPLPAEHKPKFNLAKVLIYAMVVFVSIVLLFSIVQTVQINRMQKESAGLIPASAPSSEASSPRAAPQSAPAMVGGC